MSQRRYYSTPAFAVSSLFGGPLAAIAFAAIEARSLDRLQRDIPWLVAGLTAFVTASVLAARTGLLDTALTDLGTSHVSTWAQISYRAVPLGFFAGYWVLHRPDRRRLEREGIDPVPGYGAGLAALMVGLVGGTLLLLSLR